MARRNPTACLIAITVLGAVLRFYHLDYSSLWHDEICTALRVQANPLDLLLDLASSSPFPPLYYLFMWCWTRIFGDGEFWLRMPSLVASVVSIPLIYQLARRLFNPRTGLLAAFLLSVSPYSITYAQEAKMYSLVWMLGLLSFIYFDRLVRDEDQSATLPYILSTTLALYTLYVGCLFLAVQGVVVLLARRRAGRLWVRAAGKSLLFMIPWALMLLLLRADSIDAQWWPPTISYIDLLYKLFLLTSGNLIGRPTAAESILWGFLLLWSLVIYREKRLGSDFSFPHWLLLGWMVVPVVSAITLNLLIGNFFGPWTLRYLGFVHLPLLILIGKGLTNLGPYLSAFLLILITAGTFKNHLGPYYKTVERFAPSAWSAVIKNPPGMSGENWRGLFARLREEVGPGDLIILHRSVSRQWPLKYYLPFPPCPVLDMDMVSGPTSVGEPETIFLVYRQERELPDSFWEVIRPWRPDAAVRFGHIGYFRLRREKPGNRAGEAGNR